MMRPYHRLPFLIKAKMGLLLFTTQSVKTLTDRSSRPWKPGPWTQLCIMLEQLGEAGARAPRDQCKCEAGRPATAMEG